VHSVLINIVILMTTFINSLNKINPQKNDLVVKIEPRIKKYNNNFQYKNEH